MAKAPRDRRTPDLFSWEPKPTPVVKQVEKPEGHDLGFRISRSIADALRLSELSREEIARLMSVYLEEDITKGALDGYASAAREDHNISFKRLVALAHVLEAPELLDLGAAAVGCVVVDKRWLPAIEEAQIADEIEELTRRRESARRKWRGR